MGIDINLSVSDKNNDKYNKFLDNLALLLTKYKYKFDKKHLKNIKRWYNEFDEIVFNNDKEINKYLKNIDDDSNIRSNIYNAFIKDVNINNIQFDACDNMKYNSNTIKKIYEEICLINQNKIKDIFFEEVFKLLVDYEGFLEISNVKNENTLTKIYELKVKNEEEKIFKNKLYKILLKQGYHVNNFDDICDFSKWLNNKYGNNINFMSKLKYYFNDIIDDDNKRYELFLSQRNISLSDNSTYYDFCGAKYSNEQLSKALLLAEKDENIFYIDFFKLCIEYNVFIHIC